MTRTLLPAERKREHYHQRIHFALGKKTLSMFMDFRITSSRHTYYCGERAAFM
jgi:hypothetical protein